MFSVKRTSYRSKLCGAWHHRLNKRETGLATRIVIVNHPCFPTGSTPTAKSPMGMMASIPSQPPTSTVLVKNALRFQSFDMSTSTQRHKTHYWKYNNGGRGT